MVIRLLCVLVSFRFALGCAGTPTPPAPTTPPDQPIVRGSADAQSNGPAHPADDRLSAALEPTHYKVHLDLDPRRPDYGGQVHVTLKVHAPTSVIWMHSAAHHIQIATVRQGSKRFENVRVVRGGEDYLGLVLPEPLQPGQAKLALSFNGEMSRPLFGMYRVQVGKDWYIFTQFEALGARLAFPCFDEPGFKTPFEISLSVPQGDAAFSNAPAAQRSARKDGGQRVGFAATPALPTYLVALAVGPLDVLHDPKHDLKRADGSTTTVRIITTRGRAEEARMALEETAELLGYQEEYFGSPYPFAKLDLVAVPDFAAGAMENPGLITYRDSLLLFDRKTVTHSQYRSYANTHSHEMAHMWFGDLVTMAWWDDLWLNEAFATWFARKMVHRYKPEWQVPIRALGWRYGVMNQDSTTTSRRIREPIRTRGDINNAFDGITYGKGSSVLSMIETAIGEDAFRRGVRAYLKEHARGSATFADLLGALAKASGQTDLPSAAATFIDQAGAPLVSIARGSCEGGKQTLELSQERWQPLGTQLTTGSWEIPVCVRSGVAGDPVCSTLKAGRGTMTVSGCSMPLLPNPGGGGYYLWHLPTEELKRLIAALGTAQEIDRVMVLRNMGQAVRSGHIGLGAALHLAPSLLRDPSMRVRRAALDLIGAAGAFVDDTERPKWHAKLAAIAAPMVTELGWGKGVDDPPERIAVRKRALGWAALNGHPAVVAEARRRTDALLRGDAVDREMIETAVGIAADHGDAQLMKAFYGAYRDQQDTFRRRVLLRGLSGFHRPDLVAPIMSLSLADEAVRTNERSRFVWSQSGDYRTRQAAWNWLTKNFDALKKKLPRHSARYFVYFPTSACSPAGVAELNAFFAPLAEGTAAIQGLARHLGAANDTMAQCIAQRAHHREALQEWIRPSGQKHLNLP